MIIINFAYSHISFIRNRVESTSKCLPDKEWSIDPLQDVTLHFVQEGGKIFEFVQVPFFNNWTKGHDKEEWWLGRGMVVRIETDDALVGTNTHVFKWKTDKTDALTHL